MDAQPKSGETLVWGWISSTGKPCNHFYATPNEAIDGMRDRIGRDHSIDDMYRHGFRLAMLKQVIEPVMVLDYVQVES